MEWDDVYKNHLKLVEPYANAQYSKFKKVSLKSIKSKAGNDFGYGKIYFVVLNPLVLSHLIRICWMLNSEMKLITG